MDYTKVNSFEESIYKTIEIIGREIISGEKYDKTIECVITNDSEKDTLRKYEVYDGSRYFTAYSANQESYRVDEIVYVNVPLGDFNNQKFIVGRKVKGQESIYNYTFPFETILEFSDNLCTLPSTKWAYDYSTTNLSDFLDCFVFDSLLGDDSIQIFSFNLWGFYWKTFSEQERAKENHWENFKTEFEINCVNYNENNEPYIVLLDINQRPLDKKIFVHLTEESVTNNPNAGIDYIYTKKEDEVFFDKENKVYRLLAQRNGKTQEEIVGNGNIESKKINEIFFETPLSYPFGPYTKIGIKGQFKTLMSDVLKGDFGLRVKLICAEKDCVWPGNQGIINNLENDIERLKNNINNINNQKEEEKEKAKAEKANAKQVMESVKGTADKQFETGGITEEEKNSIYNNAEKQYQNNCKIIDNKLENILISHDEKISDLQKQILELEEKIKRYKIYGNEKIYELNTKNMFGALYNSGDYVNQEAIFSLNLTENDCVIAAIIELYQDGKFYTKDSKYEPLAYEENDEFVPNILVKDIQVCFGEDIAQYVSDHVKLYNVSNNGQDYSESEIDKNSLSPITQRELGLQWVHLDENNSPKNMAYEQLDNVRIRLYKKQAGAQGDQYGGINWVNINSYLVPTNSDYNIEEEPIENKGEQATLTLTAADELDGTTTQSYETEESELISDLNSWSKTVDLNVNNGSESFKAIITVDEDDDTKPTQIYRSQDLVFNNVNEVANTTTIEQNLGGALRIIAEDGSNGNYYVYGPDRKIYDDDVLNQLRSLKLEFRPYPTAEYQEVGVDIHYGKVLWQFPTNSLNVSNAFYEHTFDMEGRVSYRKPEYRLKKTWSNSERVEDKYITCQYTYAGKIYSAQFELTFGYKSTNGTDLTLVAEIEDISFVNSNNILETIEFQNRPALPGYLGEDSKSNVTISIQGQDGSGGSARELIGDNFKFYWLLEEGGVSGELQYTSRNLTDSKKIKFTFNVTNNQARVLKIKYNNIVTYLNLPITYDENYKDFVGADLIIFKPNSTENYYEYGSYKYYCKDDTLKPENIHWRVKPETGYAYGPTISEDDFVKAPPFYEKDTMYIIQAYYIITEKDKDKDKTLLEFPLLVIQNKWFSSVVNEWEGVGFQTTTGGDITYALTNAVVAGTKKNIVSGDNNTYNTFTGVIMGDLRETTSEKSLQKAGLFGFYEGDQTFEFNSEGYGFIGAGGAKIEFNNGNDKTAIIQDSGGNFVMNLTEPSLRLQRKRTVKDEEGNDKIIFDTIALTAKVDKGNKPFTISDKFSVDWDGSMFSKAGTIGGWTIDGETLKSANKDIILNSANNTIVAGNCTIDGGSSTIESAHILGSKISSTTLQLYDETASGGFEGINCYYGDLPEDAEDNSGAYLGRFGIIEGSTGTGVTINMGFETSSSFKHKHSGGSIIFSSGNNIRLTAENDIYLEGNIKISENDGYVDLETYIKKTVENKGYSNVSGGTGGIILGDGMSFA